MKMVTMLYVIKDDDGDDDGEESTVYALRGR